ncbi:MAG TPA: hypothetical protein DCP63_11250 [Bacteroidetes bacterium]|nr:hypothetical protein [Bacteroidota bacterium]
MITQELNFSRLLALRGYAQASIISLRFERASTDFVTFRLVDVVDEMYNKLATGVLVSVDEVSAGYRVLPLQPP